jgi:hypothetical protein
MPDADDFKRELYAVFYEAFKADKAAIQLSAGDLHRRVGGYPGADHQMPVCSGVMRDAMKRRAMQSLVAHPAATVRLWSCGMCCRVVNDPLGRRAKHAPLQFPDW